MSNEDPVPTDGEVLATGTDNVFGDLHERVAALIDESLGLVAIGPRRWRLSWPRRCSIPTRLNCG